MVCFIENIQSCNFAYIYRFYSHKIDPMTEQRITVFFIELEPNEDWINIMLENFDMLRSVFNAFKGWYSF